MDQFCNKDSGENSGVVLKMSLTGFELVVDKCSFRWKWMGDNVALDIFAQNISDLRIHFLVGESCLVYPKYVPF